MLFAGDRASTRLAQKCSDQPGNLIRFSPSERFSTERHFLTIIGHAP